MKGPDPRLAPDLDPALKAALRRDDMKVYPGVIIGKELAKSLHVLIGDEITLLSPMGELVRRLSQGPALGAHCLA